MISLAHEAGALHKALAPFRKYRINMTKIESRPNKRKAWEYFFFVDCDGHIADPKLAKATAQLAKDCAYLKILGSYPNAE
jgi:chorismate mutase/prephenate dehydratase